MEWTPAIQVTEPSPIVANLLAYFETNQADAILWANGSALRPFQRFENSTANRNVPVYPAILTQQDVDQTVYDEDVIGSEYTAIFLLLVESQNPATAVIEARAYSKAIKSMIVNCPDSTLKTNTGAITVQALRPESQFNEIKVNEMENDYLQEVVISAKFQLIAGYRG